MPAAQINLPTGVPHAAAHQALTNVIAAVNAVLESPTETVSAWVNLVDTELWSAPGPFVQITLIEGRPLSLLQHLIREVSEGVAHAVGCDRDIVRVVVTHASSDLWGIGGVPATVRRAEQMAARARTA